MVISTFTALLPEPVFAREKIFTGTLKPVLKTATSPGYIERLQEEGAFVTDAAPSLYIYQVEENGKKQTGVWAQVSSAGVKAHEHIFPEKLVRIRQFRVDTGLETKPVLLTYKPVAAIKAMIKSVTAHAPFMSYNEAVKTYRIWRVADSEPLRLAFAHVSAIYVADGHHRLAANPYQTLSALLMDTSEISVKPYHRLITTDVAIDQYFDVLEAEGPILPKRKKHFGLLKDNKWYYLVAKTSKPYDTEILSALFDHIEYTPHLGGEPGKSLFTLCPLSIDEVIAAADSGTILPPKSTWIEPKIPYGLLMCRHDG